MDDILQRVVMKNPGLNIQELEVRKQKTGEYLVVPVENSNMYLGMVEITFTIKE
jgi:hypothetical protein